MPKYIALYVKKSDVDGREINYIVISFNNGGVFGRMSSNLTSVDNLQQLAVSVKQIVGNQLPEVFVSRANIGHETWTMMLEDESVVTKEVVTWTSQE